MTSASVVELIKALTPYAIASIPLQLAFATWWISKQNKKTVTRATAAQTVEFKAHIDASTKKLVEGVMSASGNYKVLPAPPPDAR